MSQDSLITRDQVALEDTWDLTVMFESDQAQEAAYQEALEKISEIGKYQGKIGESAEMMLEVIEQMLDVSRQVVNVYVYAHLKNDQDQTNAEYQAMNAKAGQLYAQMAQALAFFEPEFLQIPEETVQKYIDSNDELKHYEQYIDNILRNKPHVLSAKEEQLLALGTEVFGSSSETYGILNNADLRFPTIEGENGEKVTLTHGNFIKQLESTDRTVRKAAFEAYYSVFEQFQNTIATTLTGNVKKNNYLAKARHFDSAREASLFRNNVPTSVYDTLVDSVSRRIELLHRYTALRKQLLDVDDLEMYDMYTPLLGEPALSFTYEEAQAVVLEALAPLGDEYLEIMKKAFDERWIDVYENVGKRSGAYSSGTYDSNPYILMNWQDNLGSLYTLVHELGHSAHSYLTHKNQSYVYGNYSIFLAEIASTLNENLLTDYLLEKYDDRDIQLYVLNHFLDGVKGTVFRQTQFAEFEQLIYEADQNGTPLIAEFFNEQYQALNEKYYGDAVNSESDIKYEWARIPHFYMNFYVFQYSTGFAAASSFSEAIYNGDQETLERYLGFLSSGSSEYAVDTMKTAGLDMTKADYIEDTLDIFEKRLEEFEKLLNN